MRRDLTLKQSPLSRTVGPQTVGSEVECIHRGLIDIRPSGGIGRRRGLKILWAVTPVRVRVPPRPMFMRLDSSRWAMVLGRPGRLCPWLRRHRNTVYRALGRRQWIALADVTPGRPFSCPKDHVVRDGRGKHGCKPVIFSIRLLAAGAWASVRLWHYPPSHARIHNRNADSHGKTSTINMPITAMIVIGSTGSR